MKVRITHSPYDDIRPGEIGETEDRPLFVGSSGQLLPTPLYAVKVGSGKARLFYGAEIVFIDTPNQRK